jgi:hypothetical protein
MEIAMNGGLETFVVPGRKVRTDDACPIVTKLEVKSSIQKDYDEFPGIEYCQVDYE